MDALCSSFAFPVGCKPSRSGAAGYSRGGSPVLRYYFRPPLARGHARRTATAVASTDACAFRPCIDIHAGKVKQIVGGTLRDNKEGEGQDVVTNFETTKAAADFAEMYKEDKLKGGHVIMLGPDEANKTAAMGALAAFPGGLHVGGGINPTNAQEFLDAGASHVIVTSYVFKGGVVDKERLSQLVSSVGRQRLVLDLSCRKREDGKYYVVTDRWQKFTDVAIDHDSVQFFARNADELLVHGVDVEGMKLGIDEELVRLLAEFCGSLGIPVTYAGGVRTMEDLELVKSCGKGVVDITVGSALDIFGGDLPYDDVVHWHNQQLGLGR